MPSQLIDEISSVTDDVYAYGDCVAYMCSLAMEKCSKKSEKKKASCGGAAMRKRLLIKNFVAQMISQERQNNRDCSLEEKDIDTTMDSEEMDVDGSMETERSDLSDEYEDDDDENAEEETEEGEESDDSGYAMDAYEIESHLGSTSISASFYSSEVSYPPSSAAIHDCPNTYYYNCAITSSISSTNSYYCHPVPLDQSAIPVSQHTDNSTSAEWEESSQLSAESAERCEPEYQQCRELFDLYPQYSMPSHSAASAEAKLYAEAMPMLPDDLLDDGDSTSCNADLQCEQKETAYTHVKLQIDKCCRAEVTTAESSYRCITDLDTNTTLVEDSECVLRCAGRSPRKRTSPPLFPAQDGNGAMAHYMITTSPKRIKL